MLRSICRLSNNLSNCQSRRFLSKKYTDTDEWLLEENDCVKIGLSQKAVDALGELVYLDFSVEENQNIQGDDDLLEIESIKAVALVKSPFDCIVKEINHDLTENENLEKLSKNPECENTNWLLKLTKV